MNGKLYKFHPVTKTNADDIDTTGCTDSEKQELATMIRNGAKFYWHVDDAGNYYRVEYANIAFVIRVTGLKLEVFDSIPAA